MVLICSEIGEVFWKTDEFCACRRGAFGPVRRTKQVARDILVRGELESGHQELAALECH